MKTNNLLFITFGLFLTLTLGLFLTNCGGGGGGGSSSSGSSSKTTIINGDLDDINDARLISSTRVDGVTVQTFQDNELVGETITDQNGGFSLEVPAGEITLVFIINNSEKSINLNVNEDTVINLVLNVDENNDNKVEIEDAEEILDPIVCDEGFVDINGNVFRKIIDGDGENCVELENNCSLTIMAEDVEFINCKNCIDVSDDAEVNIEADNFECDANEDGINSDGNSNTNINTSGNNNIAGNNNGVDLDDNSSLSISGSNCTVEGNDNAVEASNDSTIQTSECENLDLIGTVETEQEEDSDEDTEEEPEDDNNPISTPTTNDDEDSEELPEDDDEQSDNNNGGNNNGGNDNDDEEDGNGGNNNGGNNDDEDNNDEPMNDDPPEIEEEEEEEEEVEEEPEEEEEENDVPPVNTNGQFVTSMVSMVNGLRSTGTFCGSDFYAPAPPVEWDSRLGNAAVLHSEDMAANRFFSHTNLDGENPGVRITAQGFRWMAYGENIAYGQPNAASAFQAWVNSPGHCVIMMNPTYNKVGIGVAEGLSPTSNNIVKYWTLDAGKPF